MPRIVRLGSGGQIVNPGSVGLQAYDDITPGRMSSRQGHPAARYAVIERGPDGWQAELRQVVTTSNPWLASLSSAGRPDWAVALRTGHL